MDLDALAMACLLLLLSLGILVAEFFLVSFGLLAVAAVATAGAAIYFAFVAGDLVGWLFVVIVPLLAGATVRWGIARVQRSGLVPQAEISADAGYHHLTQELGVIVGTQGNGDPRTASGRARFEQGECDVQTHGRALERGALIVVTAIDGPQVFVEPIRNE